MNVKANMKISQLQELKKFFVCGGGSDLSLCMGACYEYASSKDIVCKPLNDLYLGSSCTYNNDDIEKIAQHFKRDGNHVWRYCRKHDDILHVGLRKSPPRHPKTPRGLVVGEGGSKVVVLDVDACLPKASPVHLDRIGSQTRRPLHDGPAYLEDVVGIGHP